MVGLDVGEIAEQCAHGGIGAARRGAAVEVRRLILHGAGAVAHGVDVEGRGQPDRPSPDEAAHVLAPDERDVVAEAFAIDLEQAAAMLVLLLGHADEDARRCRIDRAHALGEVAVEATIFLLVLDGQRQHLAVAEAGERTLRPEREERHERLQKFGITLGTGATRYKRSGSAALMRPRHCGRSGRGAPTRHQPARPC